MGKKPGKQRRVNSRKAIRSNTILTCRKRDSLSLSLFLSFLKFRSYSRECLERVIPTNIQRAV